MVEGENSLLKFAFFPPYGCGYVHTHGTKKCNVNISIIYLICECTCIKLSQAWLLTLVIAVLRR